MTKKHYKKVTNTNYNQIKRLIEVGIPLSKVAMAFGRSYSTVRWIRKTSDYEDYRKQLTSYLHRNDGEVENGDIDSSNRERIVAEFVKVREGLTNIENWLTA